MRTFTHLVFALVLLFSVCLRAESFFFIQMTDPQFGMITGNADFKQETERFEAAIAAANRLKPAFVIVTGDLVNNTGDAAQIDEYLRIAAKLDKSIPLYNVAGNHDVGNEPTSEKLAAYRQRFGPDYYSFKQGNLFAIVLDSSLARAPQAVSKDGEAQAAFLRAELEKARRENARHIVIFQHHPIFMNSIDEATSYNTYPMPTRTELLELLKQYRVSHLFAGHIHRNQIMNYGGLELVYSGPVGKSLGQDKHGLRIVLVTDEGISHRYYEMGNLPDRVDLSPATLPSTSPAH